MVASSKKKSDINAFKKEELFANLMVPKHEIISEKEVKDLLKKLKIEKTNLLPHISKDDPVVVSIGAKVGDVLKIDRKNASTGESTYYRVVVA